MSSCKHILVVSCLVRNVADQILLVRHRQRGWELPQGRVEEGEELLTALHREVLEESGIQLAVPRLAVIWSKLSEPGAVIFCFTAQYASGSPTVSEETPEVAWFDAGETLQQVSHPVNRDRLIALLEHEGDLQFRSYRTSPYRVLS